MGIFQRPVRPQIVDAQGKSEQVAVELKARRFVLVDEAGAPRAVLGDVAGEADVGLLFYDKAKQVRAMFHLNNNGTPLLFFFHDNKSRLSLGLLDDGIPQVSLSMFGSTKARMDFTMDDNGVPSVYMKHPSLDMGLFLYPNFLTFLNKNSSRTTFGLHLDGRPFITMRDAEMTTRVALGATELEIEKTGVSIQRPESSLVLFGKDGKVIWQTPIF